MKLNIKKFFLNRCNVLNDIRYNFFFTVAMLLMLYAGDFVLIALGRSYVAIEIVITLIIIISCFTLSFCNKYIKVILSTLIIVPIAMNLNCITYFGTPMGIEEIYKSFTAQGDIFESFSYVWWIEPFIIIPYILVIFLSIYFDKKYYRSTFAMLLLFYGLLWVYILAKRAYNKDDILYATPLPTRATVINTFRTFPFALLHYGKEEDNEYPEEVLKPYNIKLVNKNSPRIIFVIWGESTQADYLSLYGKSRFIGDLINTPKLETMISNEKNKFTVLKALSSGCETEGSTTLFFNLLHEPTNLIAMAKGNKQNLFTLAKQNGYTTHWLSVSGTNVMSTGGMPADHVVTQNTHIALPESYRDDYLLEQIKKLDLSQGKHFVVVQFHSLHERYHDNYANHKDEFEHFKITSQDSRITSARKRYINNVFYLDYLLSETINFAKQNDVDYIFYTADHGETIGTDYSGEEDGIEFGHGRLGFADMIVPFLMYQKDPDRQLQKKIEAKRIMTHYETSILVANALGYEVKRPNEEKNMFFMYGSTPFNKATKIKKVKRVNGVFKEIYSGRVLDYFVEHFNFKPKNQLEQ